ncbi:46200e42-c356-48ae-a10d-a4c56bc66b69 [Thermothielavioides terrestris]|uniref:46200e42-c356-48ae-a10d-a4c56bc66b69 n=1 Tax=Thermothielavioides terrestris TaxID=2587410 RepID=A0A446BUV5_9PEZI|nr:46200e42-c356-48ae-a10d-a4c56bc66b69 [Thermothielavioides terrestris]
MSYVYRNAYLTGLWRFTTLYTAGELIPKPYAVVVDAACSLAGPSPTGSVHGGFVDLSCAPIPVRPLEDGSLLAGPTVLRWYPDGRCALQEHGGYYFIPMVCHEKRRVRII